MIGVGNLDIPEYIKIPHLKIAPLVGNLEVGNLEGIHSKRSIFRVQSGKKLHQAEKIYTDTVWGVCDKYEVCL